MRPDEARATGRAAGRTLRHLTAAVRGAHGAVSDTVHDLLAHAIGPIARPVQHVQDTFAAGVYAGVGLGLDLAARAAGHVVAHQQRDDEDRPSVHDGAAAHHVLAIGLGLHGDTMARDSVELAPALQLRRRHRRIHPTPEGLAGGYPDATGDVVVFVHGLFETEAAWALGAPDRPSYAARLRSDLGFTPVLVRYNTGLRVSESAADLDRLLTNLVAGWPVPLERLVLIGHSMGGLVVHGALALAESDDGQGQWHERVTDTVTLGTPHHGSPIARRVGHAVDRLEGTRRGRWLADFLRLRSDGIRDLMHGNVVRDDWIEHARDDIADRRTHPVPADDIRHWGVVAVTAQGRLPVGLAQQVGDLVVPHDSATHALPTPARRFCDDSVAVVAGVSHLGLLNDDRVYGQLRSWLRAPTRAT